MDLRSRVEFGSVERNETADRQAMTKTQSSSVDEGLWRGHIIDTNRAFHVLEKLESQAENLTLFGESLENLEALRLH